MAKVASKLLRFTGKVLGGGGGGGWLAGWSYRKKITLTGTVAGVQTNYQLPLNVFFADDYNIFSTGYARTTSIYSDGINAREAKVIKIGSTYFMYYMNNGDNQIWLATSADPDSGWVKYGVNPVLTKGAAGKWDNLYVTRPYVVLDGGTYYMFYEGQDLGATTYGSIGYATSADGYTWVKQTVDTSFFSSTQAWDTILGKSSCGTPSIIKKGSTYYLYYHGWNGGAVSPDIGYATANSIVGVYTEYAGNPVLTHSAGWEANWVGERDIFLYNGTYVMFYEGNSVPGTTAGHVQIGMATSPDLTTWTKYPGNPIFKYTDFASIDTIELPSVFVEGNTVRVYATGFNIAANSYHIEEYKTVTPDYLNRVVLNSHAKADFADVRFTKSNGASLLDYWVESETASLQAAMWIEFDSIPISPNTVTFYIYYGNSGASSASNGDNTFIFFDDFPGVSLDGTKWDIVNSATASVASSVLTLTTGGIVSDTNVSGIRTKNSIPIPVIIEVKGKKDAVGGRIFGGMLTDNGSPSKANTLFNYYDVSPYNWYHCYRSGGVWNYPATPHQVGAGYYLVQKIITSPTGYSYAVFDYPPGNSLFSGAQTFDAIASPYYTCGADNPSLVSDADWVRLRKYASPEPAWTSWGAEEH